MSSVEFNGTYSVGSVLSVKALATNHRLYGINKALPLARSNCLNISLPGERGWRKWDQGQSSIYPLSWQAAAVFPCAASSVAWLPCGSSARGYGTLPDFRLGGGRVTRERVRLRAGAPEKQDVFGSQRQLAKLRLGPNACYSPGHRDWH